MTLTHPATHTLARTNTPSVHLGKTPHPSESPPLSHTPHPSESPPLSHTSSNLYPVLQLVSFSPHSRHDCIVVLFRPSFYDHGRPSGTRTSKHQVYTPVVSSSPVVSTLLAYIIHPVVSTLFAYSIQVSDHCD